MRLTAVIVAILGGSLAVWPAAQANAIGYTFTDINVPGSAPGTTGYFTYGMNNLGQVVGDYQNNAGEFYGFIYTTGTTLHSTFLELRIQRQLA